MAAKKALELLKSGQTTDNRAEAFHVGIKRDLKVEVLDVLARKQDKLNDELFELEDFTLDTDINKGAKKMTQAECQERFKRIIEIRYELKVLELEIQVKTEAYNELFS